MGKFATKTGKDGQFYFNLKADNGQIILSSEGYTSTAARDNGIASVRKNAPDSTNYEKLESSGGSPYFVLKAGNGQVIGRSQMYSDERGRDNGIESVMKNAPEAEVVAEEE
jgi:uncharacterized protein